MSDAASLVQKLFAPPGDAGDGSLSLLEQAARSHGNLVELACRDSDPTVARTLATLRTILARACNPAHRRRLLCHPLLVEGLHNLAPFSAELKHWHDSTASPAAGCDDFPTNNLKSSLGNVTLPLLLRADHQWKGTHELCTDVLGRIGFPFCDWSITLYDDHREFVAQRPIALDLDRHHANWRLADDADSTFLTMPREDCLRILARNADPLDADHFRYPNARLRPRMQRAGRLGHTPVRYEPVGFRDRPAHAMLTGGVIEAVLAAIDRNSQPIHREICRLIHTIRGFELPRADHGLLESFSLPTLPGVMGVNICYTPQDELRLDPFCFTWFGHELGHTKDYLNDDILYGLHETLIENPAEMSDVIPRYGRPLAVRTLIQVPYVHLYEWSLLMDFRETGFAGLPWTMPDTAESFGDSIATEIQESFALIERHARLTPLGAAAVDWFRELFAAALMRWSTTSCD